MTRRQARHLAWVIAGLGLIGTAFGWSTERAAFPHAWLAAFSVWLGWPLGCLGLILVHALTGGRWGVVLRPQLVAGLRTSSLLLIPVAIPWLLTLAEVYPWARPGAATELANGFYLNRPFFFGRVSTYVIAWLSLSALVLRALRTEQPQEALARIAPGGLIVLALTITFSSIDLTMSLDPHFNSSVYGLITLSGMALFALSLAVFGTSFAEPDASPEVSAALGKLLLGLVLLWAYLDFMQLLIAWQSDLPSDATWYLIRGSGGWGTTTTFITVGHFVLPWCALIWPQVRRSRRGVAVICGLLASSAAVRGWWLVVPASGLAFAPVDVAAMLCVLGIGAALTLREPRNDRSLLSAAPATGGQHGR
jgi:hypothetical protein